MDYNEMKRALFSVLDHLPESPWEGDRTALDEAYRMEYLLSADKLANELDLQLEGRVSQDIIVKVRGIGGDLDDVLLISYRNITPLLLKKKDPILLLLMLYHFEVYSRGSANESWDPTIEPLQKIDPAITTRAKELAKKGHEWTTKLRKYEPPGAVQPATKPADKPPVKDQPPLEKRVTDQELVVKKTQDALSNIVRTKGIVYKGADSFYTTPEESAMSSLVDEDFVNAKREFEAEQDILQTMMRQLMRERLAKKNRKQAELAAAKGPDVLKALRAKEAALTAEMNQTAKEYEVKKPVQVGDESDHKITFPASAKNIQNRGNSNKAQPDRGIATMFEIDRKDLDAFVAQLKITERRRPAQKQGDPTKNGWNVWPQDAKTFVPGDETYGGFKKTWNTAPIPEEMLSCQSPTGDWLHVEVWGLPEKKVLLKIFTDWN